MACHQVPVGIHIWKPGPECALQHTVPTLPVNPTPRTPFCQSRTRVQVGQDRLESDPRRSTWPRGQEVQVRIEGGPESCRFTQGISTCQRRKHQCVKRRMRGVPFPKSPLAGSVRLSVLTGGAGEDARSPADPLVEACGRSGGGGGGWTSDSGERSSQCHIHSQPGYLSLGPAHAPSWG